MNSINGEVNNSVICSVCGCLCGDDYSAVPDPEAAPDDFIYIYYCDTCSDLDETYRCTRIIRNQHLTSNK